MTGNISLQEKYQIVFLFGSSALFPEALLWQEEKTLC